MSAMVARVSGFGSRHLRIKSIGSSEISPTTFSERNILPSTASRTVGNGETPASRYDNKIPRVHISAGAA